MKFDKEYRNIWENIESEFKTLLIQWDTGQLIQSEEYRKHVNEKLEESLANAEKWANIIRQGLTA